MAASGVPTPPPSISEGGSGIQSRTAVSTRTAEPGGHGRDRSSLAAARENSEPSTASRIFMLGLPVRWACADLPEHRLLIALEGQVAQRDHADGSPALLDGESSDGICTHQANGVVDGLVVREGRCLTRADLG